MKRIVVIGIVGTTLDRGTGERRWEGWRPSVAVCGHPDLLIDRFELLHPPAAAALAGVVAGDIRRISPETEVRLVPHPVSDPWDFEEVYAALHDFARGSAFDTDAEEYLVHITTGTHVAQICLFLLTESRHIPGRLLQSSPPAGPRGGHPGTFSIIDLDLSKYDRIATRFAREAIDEQSLLTSGIGTHNAAFTALVAQLEQVAVVRPRPSSCSGRRVRASRCSRGASTTPLQRRAASARAGTSDSACHGKWRR